MTNTVYLIVVLVVAFIAIVSGFRKGITRQLSSLLGLAFGAVAARVFAPEFSSSFTWTDKFSQAPEFSDFTSNLVCAVVIYIFVYAMFFIFSGILQSAVSIFRVGMFNRILGAFFSLVKNLLWLSILFNLALCFSDRSELLRYERANDGNLMAAVMSLTPGLLGCFGAEDFAHYHQLKEAKKISCNFNTSNNVIKEVTLVKEQPIG